MVVHRGVLNGGPMKVFREGISLVINFWWQIRRFVKQERYRDLDQIRRCLFDWFIQSKIPPSVPSATMKLEHLLHLYGIDIIYLDNSLQEVSEQLVVMYLECLQGDFSSVEIIQEANCRLARHLIRPNSSEVDDASQVFRQGICLLMENLWVRNVFIHHLCHSNPHPMLQQLADDILFWFTQTIKPLSLAYLERILRNELYSLPINHYVAATNGITKEVATKLMRMHKECLQGNFSSVEILREESLNQDKLGMSERIGVAPLAAAVPVVSEKIR
ncbi:pre-mRNA-splicing factor prp45, partial [Trifolium medium]|nr:pre-mRNA-splicing factor prp45 [Trifolium medium]